MSDTEPNTPESQSQDDIDAALNAAQGATSNEPAESPDEGGPADAAASSEQGAAGTAGGAADRPDAPEAPAFGAAEDDATGRTPTEASATAAEAGVSGATREDTDAALQGENSSDVPSSAPPATSTTNPDGTPKLDSTSKPLDAAAGAGSGSSAPPAAVVMPPPPPEARSLDMPDLGQVRAGTPDDQGVELLNDVDLHVKVELGRAEMAIEDVLRLGSGSIVELDKLAGDPVDVLVNERLVARGEVLILNDNFCVRISEITADGVSGEQAVSE